MTIFDSHAHYLSSQFDGDRDAVLSAQFGGEVVGIIEQGTTADTSREAVALAHRYPALWAAVGIHPEEAAAVTEADIAVIEELTADQKTVAIGEIGLDYHYEEYCPRDIQQRWFRAQLELANRVSLPVVVHDREAHEDTFNLLREYRPAGVVHCYSGSVELARELVKLGLYIGIGGVVTFKNARKTVEVAAELPLDRLLLETDAPYLAPVPYRGKRCESTLIRHVAETIAELRGITAEELCRITAENTRRLFSKIEG